MGYHLAEEVLDRCPDLPYRPFRVLMVLALDATDSTRQAKPGIEAITLRANTGRRTVLRALDALQQRGLVKVVSRAAPGRRAVYEILPMPGTGDTMLTPESGDTMLTPEQVTSAGQRVTKTGRTGDTSLSPPKPTPKPSPEPTGADGAAPTAQTIVAQFVDWDRGRGGRLTRRTIGQLAQQIGGLLAEGIAEEPIKRGLADWRASGTHPATLDSFVAAAMRPAAAVSRRQAERDALAEREMARAQARDAARAAIRGELS